jgi:hypothetical protein
MPYSYIGSDALDPSLSFESYFQTNLSDSTWELPISVDISKRSATVNASVAFQPLSRFAVNFASDEIYTYATSCNETTCATATGYLDIDEF